MPYDASNPKHVAKAERIADRAQAAAASFLRTAMSSVEGRAYFLALLERSHIFTNPFSSDALATAFNCGEMNLGQQILIEIMAECPDQYILMMREREDGRRSSDNRRSRREPDSNGRDNDSPIDAASGRYDEYDAPFDAEA